MHTLAATGAGIGIAPWLIQVGDHAAISATPEHIPGVRAFDLVANPDASRDTECSGCGRRRTAVAERPPAV